jgi:hypothetical protein
MYPCVSPIIMVPKKYGGWIMCIDYCSLNKIAIKKIYPFPRIDDLLDQLKKEKYFAKLDLKSVYRQVRIKEKYVWKTLFKTRQFLYEWLTMPFGLCNAPTKIMRLINVVLYPFIYSFVIVYMDDILTFSNTWQEHFSHVNKVLNTLRKNLLIANL